MLAVDANAVFQRIARLTIHHCVPVDCGNFAACKAFMTQLTICYRVGQVSYTAIPGVNG